MTVEKIEARNLKFITRVLNIRIKGQRSVELRPSQIERLIEAARAEGLRSPSWGGEGEGLSVALTKAGYLMSEPHLSGHRVILGFDTLDDAQAVHVGIADAILRARAAGGRP